MDLMWSIRPGVARRWYDEDWIRVERVCDGILIVVDGEDNAGAVLRHVVNFLITDLLPRLLGHDTDVERKRLEPH